MSAPQAERSKWKSLGSGFQWTAHTGLPPGIARPVDMAVEAEDLTLDHWPITVARPCRILTGFIGLSTATQRMPRHRTCQRTLSQ